MRDILQAFTMKMDGEDFGYDTEEVTIPIPTPKTETYLGGGMPLEVDQPMGAIEPLEITVKMLGHSKTVIERMATGPGQRRRIFFRGAVREELSGNDVAHVITAEGSINGGSHDTWTKGAKSGLEFKINGVIYFKYEIADSIKHEISAWPPIWIVNGQDQLLTVNQILGV